MPHKNSWKASTHILPVALQRHLNIKRFLIHNILRRREADIFLCSICRSCGLDSQSRLLRAECSPPYLETVYACLPPRKIRVSN